MCPGFFKYEDDLLKHHVRLEAWLPCCRRRLSQIRQETTVSQQRRMRYFTFCAVGAIDVLMLDVARVIRPSNEGRFDTVVFFDRNYQDVLDTQKSIPGANGFPGDFIKVVLMDDPDEDNLASDSIATLSAPRVEEDRAATRQQQILLAQRRAFVRAFPFDVVNLDLEEFLFKPNDPVPGKVINVFRKIMQWQRRVLVVKGRAQSLNAFSLMFTTQIGPPNLTAEYLDMLARRLKDNLERDETLRMSLAEGTGVDDVDRLRETDFPSFFKVAVPKIIASLLMEQDWYIDTSPGLSILEFERPSTSGRYKMLHLVMDVRRHSPPIDRRAPGDVSTEAQESHKKVLRRIFSKPEVVISDANINRPKLEANLEMIKARRRKYMGIESVPVVLKGRALT
jgi:hypothetical protein